MSDKEIYRWKLPEDHHNYTGHDDLPEAYKIEENDTADCGIVISGKYHGEWVANPWNTRTLVKHLFDRVAELTELRGLVDAVDSDLTEIFCNDVNGQNWFDKRAELRRSAGGDDG